MRLIIILSALISVHKDCEKRYQSINHFHFQKYFEMLLGYHILAFFEKYK